MSYINQRTVLKKNRNKIIIYLKKSVFFLKKRIFLKYLRIL